MLEAVVAPASRRKKRTFGCRSGARTTEWFQARTPRNQSTLRPEGKAALDKALTVIKANHGEDRVTVVGWTDSMGTDAYNLRLSLRRAEAVKAYLAEKGIALDKLASEGRGESFKYNNGTEEGRQQNRRVELHFEQ